MRVQRDGCGLLRLQDGAQLGPHGGRVVDPRVDALGTVLGRREEQVRGPAARGELRRVFERPEDGVLGVFALAHEPGVYAVLA